LTLIPSIAATNHTGSHTVSRRVNGNQDIKMNERVVGNDIVSVVDRIETKIVSSAEWVNAAQAACQLRVPEDACFSQHQENEDSRNGDDKRRGT